MIGLQDCSGHAQTVYCPDEIKTIVESLPKGTTCFIGLRRIEYNWTAEQFAHMKGVAYGRHGPHVSKPKSRYSLDEMTLTLQVPIRKQTLPDDLFARFEQTMPVTPSQVLPAFSFATKDEHEMFDVQMGLYPKPWMKEVLALIQKDEPDFPSDYFYQQDPDSDNYLQRVMVEDEVSNRPNETPITTWKATRKGEIKCSLLLFECLMSDFLKPKNQEVFQNAIRTLTQ